MDFYKQYLFNTRLYEQEKADLLWLWYDYHTEMYDQSLWSRYPSPNDETMVLLRSPEARKLSNQNAIKLKRYIDNVSKLCNISSEEMLEAKLSRERNKTMQKRIDEYLYLDEQGAFKFMHEAL